MMLGNFGRVESGKQFVVAATSCLHSPVYKAESVFLLVLEESKCRSLHLSTTVRFDCVATLEMRSWTVSLWYLQSTTEHSIGQTYEILLYVPPEVLPYEPSFFILFKDHQAVHTKSYNLSLTNSIPLLNSLQPRILLFLFPITGSRYGRLNRARQSQISQEC